MIEFYIRYAVMTGLIGLTITVMAFGMAALFTYLLS
jgi:hypothetical protein